MIVFGRDVLSARLYKLMIMFPFYPFPHGNKIWISVHGSLRMRHECNDISCRITDPRDSLRRAIECHGWVIRYHSMFIAVPEGNLVIRLKLGKKIRIFGDESSLAMR